jgi:adenosylhomocysteinase
VVTEVEPRRALEAVLDGHRVLPMAEAAALGDVFLTTTGDRDVLTAEHFAVMRDGAVLANAGHFDVEVDVVALAGGRRRGAPPGPAAGRRVRAAGRARLLLVAEGRLVNLAAGEGHPPSVMDISFAVQALTVEWLAGAELAPGVHEVPAAIDDEVARTKLASLGVRLDVLTAVQVRYLSSWQA